MESARIARRLAREARGLVARITLKKDRSRQETLDALSRLPVQYRRFVQGIGGTDRLVGVQGGETGDVYLEIGGDGLSRKEVLRLSEMKNFFAVNFNPTNRTHTIWFRH